MRAGRRSGRADLPDPPDFEVDHRAAVDLTIAYHQTGRAEIISRLERRDNALFLYLASVATILTVALSNVTQLGSTLLTIPLIGFGAALVFDQHNTVIGALGVYLAKELPEATSPAIGAASLPKSWDASATLGGLTDHIRARLGASLAIVVTPEVVAILVASWNATWTGGSIALVSASGVLTGATAAILVASQLRRRRFRDQMNEQRPAPNGPRGR